jgi:2-methylcitrate dehydratase
LDTTTQRLARYAHAFDLSTLDERSLHECRLRLVDAAACAIAAYREPFCEQVRSFAGRFAGPLNARLWGSGAAASVEMAAFANGTALRYLDFSDTYMSRNAGHPSDMIGALVATAEAKGSSGAALTAAVVVAYELYCGLCDAVALRDRGVDQATCAAVGTAAGVGRLLGLDEAGLGEAISLALAPNVHLYNVRKGTLSEWKGCAGPNGARNGVFAAMLAGEGVAGPTAVVEGEGGLFEVVGRFDWQVGERPVPRIADTHLKLHPVCYHGQSAVDAVLALRSQVSPDEIESIDVETYDAAFHMVAGDAQRWTPTTRETADHSLPFTVAAALMDGRLSAATYAPERLADPATLAIARKVRVERSPSITAQFPEKLPIRFTVHTRSGGVLRHAQDWPMGHAMNRASDAQVEAKFTAAYEEWRGASGARRALDVLLAADRLRKASELVDVLCAA